jgi:redox-sensitive bicupin YhaK (pirin superfamily)
MRTLARVEDKVRLGPDSQVDDKALIITPRDPRRIDPFLALAEDWFSEPGFEWHPHRGIETVTTVLDGVLEHGDNLGNAGALEPGDIQWMTAGRGIVHRELAFRNDHVHTLQLWINLPAKHKMVQTGYQDLRAAARVRTETPGVTVDVVAGGALGTTSAYVNHSRIQGAILTIAPGARLEYELPAGHRAFFYVLSGRARIGERVVNAGQIGWSDPAADGSASITVRSATADEDACVMTYSGTPLREPVVMGGPFVMNSRDQIEQAYRDFHAGTFGAVPKLARLKRH